MRCPFCRSDSPEGRKLCRTCGAALARVCPGCRSHVGVHAVFCTGCNRLLSDFEPAARAQDDTGALPEAFAAGRYRVIRLLGERGARRVYLAHDVELSRDVAVAAVAAQGLGEEARLYLRKLARAMAALSGQPGIAAVYDAGEQDGQPYIVGEYLGAGSLEDALRQSSDHRLPLLDALRIGEEICDALAQAHSLGVAHGGLAPAAVLFAPAGSIKLADFGFGLAFAMRLSLATAESVPVSEVAYVAPEQILGRPPEARGDLYSVGAILYEMMSGRAPFMHPDTGRVLLDHLEHEPPSLSWFAPDTPAAVLNLIADLLRKLPEDRPRSAAVVGERLRGIRSQLGPQARRRRDASRRGADASLRGLLLPRVVGGRASAATIGLIAILWAGSALILSGKPEGRPAGDWLKPKLAQASIADGRQTPRELRADRRGAEEASRSQNYRDSRPRVPTETDQAHQELIELARNGSADAQTALGRMYLAGDGTPKNYGEALNWLRRAAAQGSAQAQLGLGYMYARGEGVAQDYVEAVRWFLKAAAQGDPDAQYDLALMYEEGHGVAADPAQALRWLRQAAARSDARAQYELGRRYLAGDGVVQDYGRARQWLSKAANQGNVAAQNALGYIYEHGRGADRDYAAALHWYRKAAEQGNAKAELNLGIMYDNGEGVAQDSAQAFQWYRAAAEQGEAYAATSLGAMYCKGIGVRRDLAKALEWFNAAANQDEPKAQYNLGVMYDTGTGVAKDPAEAARWYRRAAALGNVDAQYNLGYLYEHGEGVTRDFAQAAQWYRKAAGKGDPSAQQRLRILGME
jgi:uncharacterized protein